MGIVVTDRLMHSASTRHVAGHLGDGACSQHSSSSQVPGSEHPDSGEGEHLSSSASVPWWESVKSGPPPSEAPPLTAKLDGSACSAVLPGSG